MRAVAQRVRDCSVSVAGRAVSSIAKGLLVYLGISRNDTGRDAEYVAEKLANLRIFPDTQGKMNLSVLDLDYDILVVSQFTLYGDVRRGRRPSYDGAAAPDVAQTLYLELLAALSTRGIHTLGGEFQAVMDVHYVNEGPVTILIDSQKQF